MILLPSDISNEQRSLLGDDDGGQSGAQGLPTGRLPDPFVHLEAEVQFVGSVVVKGDEESIRLECGTDLLVHHLHQGIQVEGGAGSPGDTVDYCQPLGSAARLLV